MQEWFQEWIRTLRTSQVSKFTDLLAASLAYAIAYMWRFGSLRTLDDNPHHIWIVLFFMLPLVHITYSLNGAYRENFFLRFRPFIKQIVFINLIMFGITLVVLYLVRNLWFPRSFFFIVYSCNIVLAIFLRKGIRTLNTFLARRWKVWQRPAILLGTTSEADDIAAIIHHRHPFGLTIADTLPVAEDAVDLRLLEERIKTRRARMVIVADNALPMSHIMDIVTLADRHHCATKVLSSAMAILCLRAGESFDFFHNVPLVHFAPSCQSHKHQWYRKVISQCLAGGALILLSPILGAIALLVKLSSHGPALFIQTRYGETLKPFPIYKFRTMCEDAEKMLPSLETRNEANGALFKIKDDPRITPVGQFLRRYSLDELPQILNIIKGDMRIIGPRPLPQRDIEHYSQKWHRYRNAGKPGLSCLWQVSGRSDIAFDDMCILDIYYLHNQCWEMDLRITIRTLFVMLIGRGAY